MVVLLAALWGGRSLLVGGFVRHVAVPALQSLLPGLAVHFGGASGNVISRLHISQLAVDYCQNGACLRASIPSLQVSYSLAGLVPWRGTDSLASALVIDLDAPAVSGTVPGGGDPSSSRFSLPELPALPALRVRDGSLDITVPGGATISSRGLAASAPPYLPAGEVLYAVTFSADNLAVADPRLPRQEGAMAGTFRYGGNRLEVPELTFAGKATIKGGWLETDAHGLRFAAGVAIHQSSGTLEGSVAQSKAWLSFHLAEGDIEALAGEASITQPVSGQLKADGEFTMTMGQPETLTGAVKASLGKGSWEGAVLDQFELVARAAEQRIFVDAMTVVAGGCELFLHDGELPMAGLGTKPWLDQLVAGRARARVRLMDLERVPPSWVAPIREHWQALGLEEFSAEVTLAKAKLAVAKAKVSGRVGQVRLEDGAVDLSGDLSDWLLVPWSARWQAELSRAEVIQYFWEPWPATGGSVSGQGEFSGTLADPHLPFTAAFTGSSLYGIPLARVAGKLAWTKDRLALDVEAANRGQDRLTWKGVIDLEQGGLLATSVATTLSDLSSYLPAELARDLALSGPITATAALAGEFSKIKGEVKASGDWVIDEVPLAGASMDIELAGATWSIRNLTGRLYDTVAVEARGKATPGPGWRTFKVGLDALRLSHLGQEVALQGPSWIAVSADTITLGAPLDLQSEAGTFRLSGVYGGKGQLFVTADKVSDTGWLRKTLGKDIGFSGMAFTASLSESDWRCQGTVAGLAVGGAPLTLSGPFDLASDGQGLWIKQCELGDNGQSVSLSGHVPLSLRQGAMDLLPYPLQLTGHIAMPAAGILPELFPQWLAASGSVKADFTLAGTWDHPEGQVQLAATGVEPGPSLHQAPPGPYALHGQASVARDQLTLSRLELTSSGFSLQASGTIGQLSLAALLGRSGEASAPGEIAMTGRYAMDDLAWLAARMDGLRRTGGSASGSFAVTGSWAAPEVRGDFTLVNGEARGTDSLLVARNINLKASLGHDQLTIAALTGTLGGAPVQGEGAIRGLFSPDPALDVRLTGKDLLLYRADGVKIRADSSLAVQGTVHSPELGGELMLTDSRVTRNVNWLALLKPGARAGSGAENITLFSFAEPPLRDIRFNLRIRGAQPLAISNNVFKGGIRPDLTLAGTGELPYLTGVIYADSGLITLPSGRLEMERGLARFSDEVPERPSLEVQASGRMMGYDITAQVKGAYDEPEVTLSSSPPLANEDLLMLLLTGRQPVNGRTTTASGMSSMAVYFGRGLLSRLLAGEDKEALLLERLEVDVGRAVSLQGEPTVDARLKLTDMAWQKDTSLYLTGEKDVWDDYNAGLRVVFRFQ